MSMAMERQIERMQRCPDVAMRLCRRPDETGRQEERLDQLLDRFNETCSMLSHGDAVHRQAVRADPCHGG